MRSHQQATACLVEMLVPSLAEGPAGRELPRRFQQNQAQAALAVQGRGGEVEQRAVQVELV
jgi:hypothetical protein